jgi:hypothetical protein
MLSTLQKVTEGNILFWNVFREYYLTTEFIWSILRDISDQVNACLGPEYDNLKLCSNSL